MGLSESEIEDVWVSGFDQKVKAKDLTEEILKKEHNARKAIAQALLQKIDRELEEK